MSDGPDVSPDQVGWWVCHKEEKTNSPGCGAIWRMFENDASEIMTNWYGQWVQRGSPSDPLWSSFKCQLGSKQDEYYIDFVRMVQHSQWSTRRLKVDTPATEDMILRNTHRELQVSVLHEEAELGEPDKGPLWRAYTPDENSIVVGKYREWLDQGGMIDDQDTCVTICPGGVYYEVNVATMWQTRINVDWRTGRKSRGTVRKLRIDRILRE